MIRLLLCSLLLCAAGCAPPATSEAGRRRAAAPGGDGALLAACGDLAAWRQVLLAHPQLLPEGAAAAVRRWSPPRQVGPEDQAAIQAALRLYLGRCGPREVVRLTSELIAFPTVRAEQSPSGPAFTAMAEHLSRWATAGGLRFWASPDNEAWEIWLGEGERPHVAFITHADVVPVQEPGTAPLVPGEIPAGWSFPPFTAQVRDGRLQGRGAVDDKGPLAAGLVVQRALKAFGLTPRRPVVSIIGTGEEHSWEGFTAYVASRPLPSFPISLDAAYPVVAAESGFVRWVLSLPRRGGGAQAPGCLPVRSARAGQFLTQVPGEAHLVLELAAGAREPEDSEGIRIERAAELATVRAEGRAVHSSVADTGHNALWTLAAWAERQPLCEDGVTRMLALVRGAFVGDHHGRKLGLDHAHALMGSLLVAPTLLRVDEDAVTLSVNMRRPAGRSRQAFEQSVAAALGRLREAVGAELRQVELQVSDPALADLSGPLVATLLRVYAEETATVDPRPVSIRGGTYARLYPGAVSFGPALPGRPYRGHAPDESVEVDTLGLMLRLNLAAILALDGLEPPPRPH